MWTHRKDRSVACVSGSPSACVHLREHNGGLCEMNVLGGDKERGVDIMNNLERK